MPPSLAGESPSCESYDWKVYYPRNLVTVPATVGSNYSAVSMAATYDTHQADLT